MMSVAFHFQLPEVRPMLSSLLALWLLAAPADAWTALTAITGQGEGVGSGSPGQGTGGFTLTPELDGRVLVRHSQASFAATAQRARCLQTVSGVDSPPHAGHTLTDRCQFISGIDSNSLSVFGRVLPRRDREEAHQFANARTGQPDTTDLPKSPKHQSYFNLNIDTRAHSIRIHGDSFDAGQTALKKPELKPGQNEVALS
jgi:hypothetical protein